MKVGRHKCFYYHLGVLKIIPRIANSLRCIIQNCENTEIDFPSANDNQVLTSDHYFSRTNWQLETREDWQH